MSPPTRPAATLDIAPRTVNATLLRLADAVQRRAAAKRLASAGAIPTTAAECAAWMNYEPHPLQGRILDSTARFRVVVAGRRWGKSLLAAWEAVACAVRGGRVWVVGLTYEQTDRILEPIWSFLARRPQLQGAGTRRSDRRILFHGGGFIIGKSADHADSLVGESLDLVVLDEAPIMPERVWAQQVRPCLSDRHGRALLIGTPRGHNWIFDHYDKATRDDEPDGNAEWYAWRAPTWTNVIKFPGQRADPEIVAVEAEYLDAGMLPLWDQEYGASFTALQGRVYPLWDPLRFVVEPADAARGVVECIGGADWGARDPTALTVAGRTNDGGWRILDEWVQRGKTHEDIVAEMQRLTKAWNVRRWWYDPAEPARIMSCQRHGLDAAAGWNDVLAGVMKVAHLMAQPGGFLVSRACKNLIRELDGYCWREGVARETPAKGDDHGCDSARYALATELYAQTRTARSFRIAGL